MYYNFLLILDKGDKASTRDKATTLDKAYNPGYRGPTVEEVD